MGLQPKQRDVKGDPDESVEYSEYKVARNIDNRATEAKDRDEEVLYSEYKQYR